MVKGISVPMWQARKSILVTAVLVAMAAVVAWRFVSGGSEAGIAHYQCRAASEAACDAAAIEIARLRLQSPVQFVDDCVEPKVTPVFNKPGHVIVTRVAAGAPKLLPASQSMTTSHCREPPRIRPKASDGSARQSPVRANLATTSCNVVCSGVGAPSTLSMGKR